jgi:hypothetical protein
MRTPAYGSGSATGAGTGAGSSSSSSGVKREAASTTEIIHSSEDAVLRAGGLDQLLRSGRLNQIRQNSLVHDSNSSAFDDLSQSSLSLSSARSNNKKAKSTRS